MKSSKTEMRKQVRSANTEPPLHLWLLAVDSELAAQPLTSSSCAKIAVQFRLPGRRYLYRFSASAAQAETRPSNGESNFESPQKALASTDELKETNHQIHQIPSGL
jgi:hypothetical protein